MPDNKPIPVKVRRVNPSTPKIIHEGEVAGVRMQWAEPVWDENTGLPDGMVFFKSATVYKPAHAR
jgi:hypothetical protein